VHTEELHNFYTSSNIIRVITSKRMRWTSTQHAWGMTYMYIILIRKSEGKRPLRRPQHRWDDDDGS
jgi:hypothetical protein